MTKAVFIDKDGTLIENIPFNVNPALVCFYPGTSVALQRLKAAGYKLFVITNQPGLARRYFSVIELSGVFETITKHLEQEHAGIDGYYYCPHDDTDGCSCRKPKPGLLIQASLDYNIKLKASWMIGDILHDVEAGNKAGCKTILLDNGNETEWIYTPSRTPFAVAYSLKEAADLILNTDRQII